MMKWTAVVLAGSRPGRDAFAERHGVIYKALIPVAGVPMVRRPVDALLSSELISKVVVLTQDPEAIAAALPADNRIEVRRSESTIADTLLRLCSDPAIEWPLLVTTADHAFLTPAIIEDFASRTGRTDIAIGVVERRRFKRRLPDARRTWYRFKGGAYSGANLFVLRAPKVAPAIQLWRSVEQDRKKVLSLIGLFGPRLLFGVLFRLVTLERALQRISRNLNMPIRVVELADPLAAVDVDKESDLQLAERFLRERG